MVPENVLPEVVSLFDNIMELLNPVVNIGQAILRFAGNNWILTAGIITFYILLTTHRKLHTILSVAFVVVVGEILIAAGVIPPIGVIFQEVKNIVG